MLGNIVASGFGFAYLFISYRLRASRNAVLMSVACVRLSPPASKINSVRPRFLFCAYLVRTFLLTYKYTKHMFSSSKGKFSINSGFLVL
jgi:hypothetical protein